MSEFKENTEIDQNLEEEAVSLEEQVRKLEEEVAQGNTEEEAEAKEAAATTEEATEEEPELTPEQQLEAAKAKADENYSNYLRAVADLDTYRRRVMREKDELRQVAVSGLLESILPIYDNMTLGLNSAEQSVDPETVVQGIQMVLGQFKSVLQEYGIEEIEPQKGDEFDPNKHEAFQTQPSDEVEDGHVLQLVRKGFALKERLVRPASVIVAGKPS